MKAERLKKLREWTERLLMDGPWARPALVASLDEIERLTQENERFKAALKAIEYGIFKPQTDVERAIQRRAAETLAAIGETK